MVWPLRRVMPERASSSDHDGPGRYSASDSAGKQTSEQVAANASLLLGTGGSTMTTSPMLHWETTVSSDAHEFRHSGDPFPTGELPVTEGYDPEHWREVMGANSAWSQRVEDLDWFSSLRVICRFLRLFQTAYQACSAEAQKARRVPSHRDFLSLRKTFEVLDECVSRHQLVTNQVTQALLRMGRVLDKREQTLNSLSQRAGKSVHEGIGEAHTQLLARVTPGNGATRVSTAQFLIQLQKLDKTVNFFVSMLYSALGQECCTTMYEVRKHLTERRYRIIQEGVYENSDMELSHQGKCAFAYWQRKNAAGLDTRGRSAGGRLAVLLNVIAIAYAGVHARKHVMPLMAIKRRYVPAPPAAE